LASDTISNLAERKGAEIVEARRKLDAIVARQIKIESSHSRSSVDTDAILLEKQQQLNVITRLESESALLEGQVQSSRPPRLSPEQQWRREMFSRPAPEHRGGTPEQIRNARRELDGLLREYRALAFDGSRPIADAKLGATINRARLKLAVLEGPYPEGYAPWINKENWAMRKELGL
jgi:hypothetical protein